MPMIKYTPFTGEMEDFPTGLRLFQDSISRLFSEPASRPWSPAVDIYETENELVLKADIPDVIRKCRHSTRERYPHPQRRAQVRAREEWQRLPSHREVLWFLRARLQPPRHGRR